MWGWGSGSKLENAQLPMHKEIPIPNSKMDWGLGFENYLVIVHW